MPCNSFKIGNVKGILCGGRGKSKACYYCGQSAEFLCDFPVGKYKNGKSKTCDRNLCFQCVEPGLSPNIDFCREHYPPAKEAFERRMKKAESEKVFAGSPQKSGK